MPIESAVYISDLNAANPPDADPVGQADDHLRLIKAVLKATFPNLTGPVTSTQLQLNSPLPPGVITWWYGLTSNVPTGWALCNGQTVARADGSGNITTPNLTDSFIRSAAGGTVTPGSTGGASSHSHAVTVGTHALTIGELPAHSHGVNDSGHNHTVNDPGHTHQMGSSNIGTFGSNGPLVNNSGFGSQWTSSVNQTGITLNANTTGISIQNTGSGTAHGHPGSTSDSQSNIPPYVGLVPIMKI